MADKPLRVLIVEDSEDDALLLVRELKRGGYAPVFERVDTREAMSAALDEQTWDVVLSDYHMPHFSGLAALVLLKEKGLDLPFILVSGKIGEDLAVEAMKARAHDFVMKDKLARLNPTIERELGDARVRQERKRAEEALAETAEKLENRVRELEAVNRFNLKLVNERAELIAKLERRVEQLSRLHRMAREIYVAPSPKELLNSIVSHLSQVAGSDFTSIVLVGEGGNLVTCAETGKVAQPFQERARPGGLTRTVIATGKPIYIPNYLSDPRSNPLLVVQGIKSWAGVPLIVEGKVKGVLIVRSLREDGFAEDMEVLEATADLVGLAISRFESV